MPYLVTRDHVPLFAGMKAQELIQAISLIHGEPFSSKLWQLILMIPP